MNLSDQFKSHLSDNNGQASKVTIKNYSSDTRKFILWCEKKLGRAFDPNEITKELADSYIQEISENNHSSRSAKRYQSSIKKFFNFLLEQKVVRFNPFNLSTNTAQLRDPWSLKEFSNFLYNSKTSNHTIKNYISDIRQFLTWTAQVTQTSDVFKQIDSFLIEEYKNRLLGEANFSPLSVNRKLSSLRKYLSFAKEKNLINPNFDLERSLIDLRIRETNPTQEALITKDSETQTLEALVNQDEEDVQENEQKKSYSGFPPLRLLQKMGAALTLASDLLIIASIIKAIEAIKYKLWIATGKEVFATLPQVIRSVNSLSNETITTNNSLITTNNSAVDQFITRRRLNSISDSGQIKSIPKSVYAPLEISTRALPFWERIIHTLRYSRPDWYKQYHNIAFVHYLHFAVMVLFATFVGFKIYQSLSLPRSPRTVLASHVSPKRQIAFHGALYDQFGVPIIQESRVKFAIYKSPTNSGPILWQESQIITPDNAGNFSTVLGKNTTLSQDIFNDNPNLYMGISIGSAAELTPRQELANTGLTKNSQTLQGLKPITVNNSDSANTILALDSSGNLTIGGNSSPIFQATGGEFKLSGQSLILATNEGSNGNITLAPDGTGIIDIRKPLQNTSNSGIDSNLGAVEIDDNLAILASSSAQSALVINQNGTGDLISAQSSGSAKFSLNSVGSGSFSGDLSVLGNNFNTASGTFNLANTNTFNLNIGGAATAISIGAKTGTTTINNGLTVTGTLKAQGPVVLSSFTQGTIPFIGANSQISSDSASLFWDQGNKRLGIGTKTPSYRLDIQDSQDSKAAAQIFNSSTSASSVGLQIKLGITDTPQLTNRWINFLDGNGAVMGKISGSGSTNSVKFESNGGDFAEYFKKSDPLESFGSGDLICYSAHGGVEKCNQNSNGILGIFSDEAGFVGSGSHEGDSGYVLVGLIGQLKINVSSSTEAIKPGDPITSSSIPGIAVKATKPGQIIGRALESYDPASNQPTIKIALNVSWYDPRAVLMNDGSLTAAFEPSAGQAYNQTAQNYEKLAVSIQNFVSTLNDGVLVVEKVSTNSLSVATDDIKIGTQTLKEYISGIVNEIVDRKIAQNNKNQISIVSPLSDPGLIINPVPSQAASAEANLQPTPPARNASASVAGGYNLPPTQSITNITNIYNTASPSAIIASGSATVSDSASPSATPSPAASPSITPALTPTPDLQPTATPSATPTPVVLTNNPSPNSPSPDLSSFKFSIVKLKPADIATYSAELSYIPNLKSDFATFSEGLIALGPTSLTETSINGTLSLGSSMKIGANSIDTLSTDLNLQPLRQGNLSIMGGLISVDTEGNLSVQGNANFAKDVKINGTLAAGIISPLAGSDLVVKLDRYSDRDQNLSGKDASDPGVPQDDGNKFKIRNSNGNEVLIVNQLGDIIASGSAKFGNIKIIRGAQADTSLTETVASGSAGIAIIKATQTERTIVSPFISENSLIYITPATDTKGITPYIARQTAEEPTKGSRGSFTIQIPASQLFDIKLNWIIVN